MSDERSPVQGVELWVPKDEALVLRSGAYGRHSEFARVSARTRFRRGEGLPGAVWATQQALVWHDLGSHFVRAEYAAAAGIDAALAFPWFQGRDLAGVLVFLLTESATSAAAIEIWNHDESMDVLRHGGGVYPNAEEFENLSKLLQFPYAAGLPGLTWSRGIPTILDDVGASNEFVRAEIARKTGLKRALGVPIYRERRVSHVLTLIASGSDCFVRACQLYGHGERGLVSRASFAEPGSDRHAMTSEALARDVWLSPGLPLVTPLRRDTSGTAGATASEVLLTLPIYDGVRLRGVACFEF